jgi:hypothetical protein
MIWVGMDKYKISAGRIEGKRPLGRPGIDDMILELILGKQGGRLRGGTCSRFL